MDWNQVYQTIDQARPVTAFGRVEKVSGLVVQALAPNLAVGAVCRLETDKDVWVPAEVVGFAERRVLLMPYGDTQGLRHGSRVHVTDESPTVPVGDAFLGRVVDGLGQPVDHKGRLSGTRRYPLYGQDTNPLKRRSITEVADVGIRALNGLCTIGRGQRVGIMAGSGVGKSVLFGMIARHTKADVCIVALIGERGREVKDFVTRNLDPESAARTVVVAATSDAPPLVRMRGAYLATALAEYFRDQGQDVLLMMDSITRFAMSSRDVGLAAGEPPKVRGYTPSFFVKLPRLLERAGSFENAGSITGIYTVLVDGDDMNDPVADAVRSIVDGHVVLSRDLAHQGHYPAIDILASTSRVMHDVVSPDHRRLAQKARHIEAVYRKAEDLISVGAYTFGSDPEIDEARKRVPGLRLFLQQDMDEAFDYDTSIRDLDAVFTSDPPAFTHAEPA